MKEVEKQLITKIITQDFGISMHLKGSHYLEEVVALALQNSSVIYHPNAKDYSRGAAGIGDFG